MFPAKPSFLLSLFKNDKRFAQSQTRCHPHQPSELDGASECFESVCGCQKKEEEEEEGEDADDADGEENKSSRCC